ncbi:MAG: hypothetical protein AB7J40_05280 [Candidatus Altimarinota bacterium]
MFNSTHLNEPSVANRLDRSVYAQAVPNAPLNLHLPPRISTKNNPLALSYDQSPIGALKRAL